MSFEPRQFNPCASLRRPAARVARIVSSAGHALRTCSVVNLSPSGATLRLAEPATAGRRFALLIDGESTPRQCELAWSSPAELGVTFLRTASLEATPPRGSDMIWR